MFQDLIDQSSDALYVADGTTGQILYVNDQACQDLGYTRGQLLGMNVSDIDPNIPQDATGQQKFIQALERKRQLRFESEHRRADGSIFPVELSIKAVTRQGRRFGVVIARDITERRRAEEALRQSEERFREAFESANVGMCLVSPEGYFLKANAALTEMLGYSEEELRTKTFNDVTLPEDHHISRDFQRRALAGLTSQARFEKRYLSKSGRVVWVQVSSSLLRDARGGPLHFVAHIVDVTERARMDALLEEHQHFLQRILDTEPGTVYIFDLVERRNTYINRPWLTEYGYTPEEKVALGADLLGLLFHPDDLARIEAHHESWRQAGEGETREIDYRVRTKDGQWRWLHSQETAFTRDKTGLVTQILGIAHDITEQLRSEQALRESEERYRRLFNAGTDAIFVHELTAEGVPGRFVEVNEVACRRLGYTRDEMLTMSPGDIDAPDKRAGGEAAGRRLLEKKHIVFEMVHVARNGTHIPVEISANLFRHQGRNMVLSVARDLSERRRLEAQFLQAQKMEAIGRLAGGVAHDFNNLLTVITGVSEISMNRLSQTHPLYKDLEQISAAGHRAAALTRQLLAFSRRQIIEPTPLNLNTVLAGLEKMLRRLIGEDIDLVVEPDVGLGTILADAGQIEQLLINLAVNSRDAMPEGGQLTIATMNVQLDETFVRDHPDISAGPYVRLTVSDTGRGMSDEAQAHVFEPFYTTKAEGQGTGLGLATVYGIVKQAGGAIDFTSQPDQGTTFRICLPRREPGMEPKAIEIEAEALPRGSETILVVEDEPEVRRLACRMLEHLGYNVLESQNVGDALRMVAQHDGPIHLLLTDVIMPEMSGREAANRISLLRPDIKILFMSGYPDETIARHGVLAEGINLLNKPFTSKELAGSVRRLLDQRGRSSRAPAPH
jgi:two-component system cell cycle sensor histidine kinase/response regulator CckA